MSSMHEIKYFILDPSFFTSVKRLEETFLVLDDIFQNDAIVIKKPKVVLASALRGINYVHEEKIIPELQDVLARWGLSKKNYQSLFTQEYDQLWRKLLHDYDITFADDLVGNTEKIGENSLEKARDFFNKIRNIHVANTVWEQIACCNLNFILNDEPHTWIICRSKQLPNILSEKIKLPMLEGTSRVKASIKEHHRLHGTLRFLCHNMQSEPLEQFIADTDITTIPLPLGALAETGLVIVADG